MRVSHARQLIAARNTRHRTIKQLEAAIGHRELIRNLDESARNNSRMPRADWIHLIAGELDSTEPVELLIAYARDAGVKIPAQVDDAYRLTARLGRLSRDERARLVEILSVFAEMLGRARRQRRR